MPLPPLQNSESLGRSVFSSGQAKRARKNIILPAIFLEAEGTESLSVDRLDHAPISEMAEIGDRIASARGVNRRFYGWAVLTVETAIQDGRTVRATPKLDNPFHADIDLNISFSAEQRDKQIEHVNALALEADWRERP